MSDYFGAQIMIAALTVYGLRETAHPQWLLCAMGLFLLTVTAESLPDAGQSVLSFAKVLLAAAYCVLSPGFLTFLLWGLVRRRFSPALPFAVYVLWQIPAGLCRGAVRPAAVIAGGLVLWGLSSAIWVLQRLLDRYLADRKRLQDAIGRLALEELKERKLNRSLLMQSAVAEKNARLEERENISRSIHNSVGHTITAASAALDAAEVLWEADREKALAKVQAANERVRQGLFSIRHAVRVLDAEAEEIAVSDFVLELQVIAEKFMLDADVRIFWSLELLAPELVIVREHTEFLTGAFRELLTNGVRHGHADRFLVQLLADSGHVRLSVTDNGFGGVADSRISEGFGIRKIRKYVEKNGGAASFTRENGFCALLSLPVGRR